MSENLSSLQSKLDRSSSWNDIWSQALSRPSRATFQNIANDTQVSARRAYGWILISGLLGYAMPLVAQLLHGSVPPLISLWSVLMVAVAALLIIMLMAGATQLVAQALGGTGTYTQLVYVFAAFNAPLAIINGLSFAFPPLRLIWGVYWLGLNIIATGALNQFGWRRAVVALLPGLLGMALVLFAAMGLIAASRQGGGR